MIFYTSNCTRFASDISLERGMCLIKNFSDGEIFVKVLNDVEGQEIWVVADTQAPADNLLEMFFLLDALNRAGAEINLLVTYFAYARQDKFEMGEAFSAKLISEFLKNFNIKRLEIFHAHSKRLHEFLNFNNVWPVDIFCNVAKDFDVLIAPDCGAREFVQFIAEKCGLKMVSFQKFRPGQEMVEIIKLEPDIVLKDKKVLILDDIISTGKTVLAVNKALKKLGVENISVMATHGIFSGDSLDLLEVSFEKIYITNTVIPEDSVLGYDKVQVLNISSLLEEIMKG